MSRKTKTTATKEEAKPAMVPKLRFPEFRGAEGWKETPLQKIARPVSDRAVTGDGDNVLSLSGEHGLVLQSDYFGKKVAGDSAERYLKLRRDDFVYNDRTTKASTFGTIKRLSKYDGGIVSPIYKCFRFRADENPVFWEWYFESGSHVAALRGLVNEGARAGRFNISISQFLSTAACRPDALEQQKIAECLSSVDELMAAQARKVDALKTHKKGLMQQLFPREGETQPRLRFLEFQNAGEWKVGLIGDLATTVMGNAFRSTDFVESGTQVVRIGNLYQGELQLDRAPVYLSDAQAEENARFRVLPLDLLMSMTGTVGKRDYGFVIQVPPECKPLLLNQRVMKLAPTSKCDPGFLLQLLKSDRLLDAIYSVPGGTKQANLSAQHIKDLAASYPPKPEQQRIAMCLSSLDALITAETQKHEALKTHKKGLMQQLFPSPEEVAA